MVWIVALWAVIVLPNLTARSFIWEEGTNAELARHILAHGDPFAPQVYGVRWIEAGAALEKAISAAPAPAFTSGRYTDVLFYVRHPILEVDLANAGLATPAWLLVPGHEVQRLRATRPDLAIHVVVATSAGPHLVAARVERRAPP